MFFFFTSSRYFCSCSSFAFFSSCLCNIVALTALLRYSRIASFPFYLKTYLRWSYCFYLIAVSLTSTRFLMMAIFDSIFFSSFSK